MTSFLARGATGFLIIAVLWGGGVFIFEVPRYLLPSPGEVLSKLRFLHDSGHLLDHVAVTAMEVALGFSLGLLLGVAAAVIFARVPWIERSLMPIILVVQTAPKIAIAPLLLLWLGLGPAPKVVLIVIVTFFPVMAATLSALRHLPDEYRQLATLLKLRPATAFLTIEFPATLPAILSGATVATTLSMTAAVIGELMGANKGLGYLLASGQENADAAVVIGAVLILSVFGWMFFEALEAVRRHVADRYSLQ